MLAFLDFDPEALASPKVSEPIREQQGDQRCDARGGDYLGRVAHAATFGHSLRL
jgi:hypothetical protein